MISIYDVDADPVVNNPLEDGKNRTPFVDGENLWLGTSAIPDGTTYRFELRKIGFAGMYEISKLPAPSVVVAFQIADPVAYIGAIEKLPNGKMLFMVKRDVNTTVYSYAAPTLATEDAPGVATLVPLLGVLQEEAFACYTSLIRKRDANGVWANASVTPAPTSYDVVGIHEFKNSLWFFVNANYTGTLKAEVWKYTQGNSIVLDKSYTGTSPTWNRTYTTGGVYNGRLYGCWHETTPTNSLVSTDGSGTWRTDNTGIQVGEIIEFRGEIYGQYQNSLYSGAKDPIGDWTTISTVFQPNLVVF